jgi:hypothetical protein
VSDHGWNWAQALGMRGAEQAILELVATLIEDRNSEPDTEASLRQVIADGRMPRSGRPAFGVQETLGGFARRLRRSFRLHFVELGLEDCFALCNQLTHKLGKEAELRPMDLLGALSKALFLAEKDFVSHGLDGRLRALRAF